ncbi:leucine-rich repeat domain-containing protein [Ruminococcus sp.]|uniref:leucine-rich repeat domain-containing protein n=1 Tax=Ruminococcus sp. TaxID=41978 RepID=UPI001B5C3751|nr:leucine-rich repeat domain-containing protein [Ruminococcus sp.]MBP5430686.1 leucine-rich repeat domain-containing protein [Ruminococcus sp.]
MAEMLLSDEASICEAEMNGLMYSVHDGEAAVTGYTGEPEYVNIPDFFGCYPVTELRDNAFYMCETLRGIILPDTVAMIGHHCFYACDMLEAIRLPEGLEEIGEGCFCGCIGLKDISLPASLDELPASCFRACESLAVIELPQDLKGIGELCFSGCESLKRVSTGMELGSIGGGAFYMCPELEYIFLPPACTNIGAQALGYGCTGNELIINEDMVIIGEPRSAAEKYAIVNGLGFSSNLEGYDAALTAQSKLETGRNFHLSALAGAAVFAALIIALIRCLILQNTG